MLGSGLVAGQGRGGVGGSGCVLGSRVGVMGGSGGGHVLLHSRVWELRLGGLMPMPEQRSARRTQMSGEMVLRFAGGGAKSKGPTKYVSGWVMSRLSVHKVYLAGLGLSRGQKRMWCPKSMMRSEGLRVYWCHSGHHRLSTSLRGLSVGCLAKKENGSCCVGDS